MSSFSYKLDVFEGPLDLLIALIQKNKLNIYDIKILDLVNQYISYINKAKDSQLYIASEFLDMAARLVYIKSVHLLPKPNDAEKLKEELQGELIEYQLCKDISLELSHRANYDQYVKAPEPIDFSFTYDCIHEAQLILCAYINAFNKKTISSSKLPMKEEVFFSSVKRKVVSVASRVEIILGKLKKTNQKIKFFDLFEDCKDKSDYVATFLAILGLVKDKKVCVCNNFDNMYLSSPILKLNSKI